MALGGEDGACCAFCAAIEGTENIPSRSAAARRAPTGLVFSRAAASCLHIDVIGKAWSTPSATHAPLEVSLKSLTANSHATACLCLSQRRLRYSGGSPNDRVPNQERSRALAYRSCLRLVPSPGPDTRVGVSDERREQHCADEEYAHAQQDHIDDVM